MRVPNKIGEKVLRPVQIGMHSTMPVLEGTVIFIDVKKRYHIVEFDFGLDYTGEGRRIFRECYMNCGGENDY